MPDEQRRAYLLVHFRTTLLIWAACTTIFHGLTLSQTQHSWYYNACCLTGFLIVICLWFAIKKNMREALVPQLVGSDLPALPKTLFRVMQFFGSISVYLLSVGHSLMLSVVRASFVHALANLCYLFVEANIQAAFALHLQTKKREKEGLTQHAQSSRCRPNIGTQAGVAAAHASQSAPHSSIYKLRHQVARVAITIHGGATPDQLSTSVLDALCVRLRASHKESHLSRLAVRTGCVVVGFNLMVPVTEQCNHNATCCLLAIAARRWAEEYGLLRAVDTESRDLSVQVSGAGLRTCVWRLSGGDQAQAFSSPWLCSISLHTAALLLPSQPCSSMKSTQQQGSLPPHKVAFTATICGPPPSGCVRSWAQSSDSPEEDSPNTFRLLAVFNGQFVPLEILQCDHYGDDKCEVKASLLLPDDGTVLEKYAGLSVALELWNNGMLVCSTLVLLLSGSLSPVLKELEAAACMQQQGRLLTPASLWHDFLADLAEWLQFSSLAATTPQEFPATESEPMASIGQDLLRFCVHHGLDELAGLLMTGLTEEPFNLPFSTLLYGNAHPELEEEGQLAHTHSFSTSLCCVRDRTKAAAEAAAAASASATAATATLMLLEQDQMLSKENQESLARNSNDEDRICSDTITASTTFSGSNSIDENSSCPVPIDEKRLESTTWPNGLACVLGAPARFSLAAVCASCLLVICMASAAVVLCSE